MPGTSARNSYTCLRCLRALRQRHASSIPIVPSRRQLSSHLPLLKAKAASKVADEDAASIEAQISNRATQASVSEPSVDNEPEKGAMSRRLEEATEDALAEGGRAGRKAIEEAGFSEELKARLLERVQAQKFQSENAAAFAEAGLSSAVGRGTRDIAAAQAWTGVEATEDTVLRMLTDAHKPLKPELRGQSKLPVVDFRINREPRRTSGQRLANARDKTSIYASAKDVGMSENERDAMRKELKERFTPGARSMPNSIRGLQALANERIEDAIARGQFKNIPRGKAIERDARADNPFIDTTEYLMNKMIKRQDIVPPWIEKQQELVKAANVFRSRLRNDWKRHAARSISSRGGSLQDQVRIADRYAESERVYNPKTRAVEQISVPTNLTSDPVMISITQEAPKTPNSEAPPPVVEIRIEGAQAPLMTGSVLPPPIATPILSTSENPQTETSSPAVEIRKAGAQEGPLLTDSMPLPLEATPPLSTSENPRTEISTTPPPSRLPFPFRDASWEAAELSYLKLAVANLNSITRSYNLMAPDLAKKPYFNVERELRSCYADVAPQLGQAICERAARPGRELVEKVGHRPGGVLERFAGEKAQVFDNKKPLYGLREFWNDLWGEKRV